MKIILLTLFLCFVFCLTPFTGIAPAAATDETPDIRVGIRSIKPFIFLSEKGSDQEPTGFSIDLWKAISKELGGTFTYVPSQGISHTLDDIINGKIDLAIGAISVTKDREEKIDFSYSNFHTGLSILVPDNEHFPRLPSSTHFSMSNGCARPVSSCYFYSFPAILSGWLNGVPATPFMGTIFLEFLRDFIGALLRPVRSAMAILLQKVQQAVCCPLF